MENNETDKKRDELISSIIERRYTDEIERAYTIDEQSRSLVGSILVVVGFLLAAGTTSIVNMQSTSSLLYFIGISLLVSSIFTVFVSLRLKKLHVVPIPYLPLDWYTSQGHQELSKWITRDRHKAAERNFVENRMRAYFLRLAWLFLISGLIVVMSYIIFSVIL